MGSVAHEDGADDLAVLHGLDGVVHLVEVHRARDHCTDVELAVLDEADEAREIAWHRCAAVHAPEDLLLLEHGHRRKGPVAAELVDAPHVRGTRGGGAAYVLPSRFPVPHHPAGEAGSPPATQL